MRFRTIINVIWDNYHSLYESQTIIPKDVVIHVKTNFLVKNC